MLHFKPLQTIMLIGVVAGASNAQAQSFTDKLLQRTSVNLSVGIANYGGDLQQRRITFNQAKRAIGLGISYDLAPRFKLRGEYMFAKIGTDDKLNNRAVLQARNLNFNANLFETAVSLQYDFWDIEQKGMTPYVFAGVAYFKASPYTYDATGQKVFLAGIGTEGQTSPYSTKHVSIPFGAGLTMNLTDILSVSLEAGFRKTFTDYIDDVSGSYADVNTLSAYAASLAFRGNEIDKNATYPAAGEQRGNPSSKDYYYFGLMKFHANLGFLTKNRMGCARNVL